MKGENDELKELALASLIPKEMFWGYEAVRQSGLYNMFCVSIPSVSNNTNDKRELISAMDECYIRYCIHSNADITKDEYKHVTSDHVLIIQKCYELLLESYGLPPKGICEVKRNYFPAHVETRII